MQQNKIHFQKGLYNPAYEHDACGVGLVTNIYGEGSHSIVENGLTVLEHMDHRGGEGADPLSGDGAGIMVQVPHDFICAQGIPVPARGEYGTGLLFLPKDKEEQELRIAQIEQIVKSEGLNLLALRDVPVNNSILGNASGESEPAIKQLFVTNDADREISFELRLYLLRKKIEKFMLEAEADETCYIVSLSSKRMVYKGMLTTAQLRNYYQDLTDERFTSAIALVHSRFSTNTFPSWRLAQPFRLLAHNGEINTIKGNRRWMEARESVLHSPQMGDTAAISPIVQPHMSDSASLDNVLEYFIMSGMSLPHALAMLVPESFNEKNPISSELKAFYEYHSILMEAWDGPATLLFTDGRYAGGMLDRNGLRPARYLITNDGMMVIASEAGVLPFDQSIIKEKGRLKPGRIIMVDTAIGKVYQDQELKAVLAAEHPYGEWLRKNRIKLDQISSGRNTTYSMPDLNRRLMAFGYHKEDISALLQPMAREGNEPISSMGNDTPIALFSEKPQLLFNYFRQQFAQVTNPPIDPIREELVMSLSTYIGVIDKNLLDPSAEHCKMVEAKSPILTNKEIDILQNLRYKGFRTKTFPLTFEIAKGAKGLEEAVDNLCKMAEDAVDQDYNYLILSDREISATMAPVPTLLAVSAVHQYLVRHKKRLQTALVVETGEARETMHMALLLGYGASAINPYGAFAVVSDLIRNQEIQLDYASAEKNYIKALNKGLLKIMSKMGISTMGSYKGAQLFEAIGISTPVIDKYFTDTPSKVEGISLEEIYRDVAYFHKQAFGSNEEDLNHIGLNSYRKDGEYHAWNPETIATLQLATRLGSYKKFKEYSSLVDGKKQPVFLRDRLDFRRNPIDISEVEPASEITRRFVTGAMSFGSISKEAHEAMAIAMNRIGGKSNTGEGGEDPARFETRFDGTSARSAIKQVASGRFGVTTNYLVNADEIQIKVAQGAKPGEGGQLPGFKVDEVIAKTRNSIPGITLISPPPHHDIYSIEDLAQLIFDLRSVNPAARISVKLVSESGVGTIAAGVAKAKADAIIISGAEGGTGASPASSIRHAGLPSEIGLAETQQILVMNHLRGQVTLQVDGQLKTGRDIVIQALLGAEEFGFATSALIVLGCVMMRKCHLNTCPMGVATQNKELRERFIGRADYLVNFFNYLAEEVREILAEMGFRSLNEVIGRSDLLYQKENTGIEKADKVDLSRLLWRADETADEPLRKIGEKNQQLPQTLNSVLASDLSSFIRSKAKARFSYPIHNTDRAIGATLSGKIAMAHGEEGLPEDTIHCTFEGSAGQSFGAFLAPGVTFRLRGEANDYVGKGLSGGRIIISPPFEAKFVAAQNIIAGNTILYGATSGEMYINGRVGERFCVRNSGAIAVVEGAGDHCCEYMTGGRTVVLGKTGRNFAAGMSGGIAYVWDEEGNFDESCNMEMVELSLIEDRQDMKELHALLENHLKYTQSATAKRILENWEEAKNQFIKVMPIEYKKIIQAEQMRRLQEKIDELHQNY
ncbi:MAG: glutamate synthase large subunit [Bacteroidales bacterium]